MVCLMDAGGGSGYSVGTLGWGTALDGCAWRKRGWCCLKWFLLALYRVGMTQNSTSMAVSSAQVFTAILMGVLGNTTAEWGGNSWEDRKKKNGETSKY